MNIALIKRLTAFNVYVKISIFLICKHTYQPITSPKKTDAMIELTSK